MNIRRIALTAGAAIALGTLTVPAYGATAQNAAQCNVRIHFTVSASGTERTRVAGQCAGHAPTAGQVARLAAPLVTTPGIRHRGATFCRDALGVRETHGCYEFQGTNTTVIFDSHGRVTTS